MSITTLSLNTVFEGNDNQQSNMLEEFNNNSSEILHIKSNFSQKDHNGNTLLHNFVRCSLKDDKCKKFNLGMPTDSDGNFCLRGANTVSDKDRETIYLRCK